MKNNFTDLAEYVSWTAMIHRCTNPNAGNYDRYGGRGITICERWRNSFQAFYDDMGPKPSSEHSLDRYPNNDGNYEPGNCRWATATEQNRNRSNTRRYAYKGQMLTLMELSEQNGIDRDTLKSRLESGVPPEEATSIPVRQHRFETYTFEEQTLNLRQWSKLKGINYHTLRDRILKLKLPIDKALST